jgi:protein TonB
MPPPAAAPAVADRTTGARYLAGGLLNSDNPRGQFQGTVSVRFTVEPTGQVTGCRPLVSSGNPALDGRTCLLVEQRLRFAPALDRQGRPVASEIRASYTWGRRQRRR